MFKFTFFVLICAGSLSVITACEPIVDFSSTASTNAEGANNGDGILRPTLAEVRPKITVDVPKDPPSQILLLTNDSSKGWQLKKRQRQGVDTLTPCDQDDGLIIYSSKRIDFEIGAIRCGIDDKKQTGFWQLTDRPGFLVSLDGAVPYEVQLLALSTNRMIISYTDETNEPVLEIYETPVAQEPLEEGPIVLTPTPAPTTTRPQTNASSEITASPTPEATSTPATPAAPGSGPFKTGL